MIKLFKTITAYLIAGFVLLCFLLLPFILWLSGIALLVFVVVTVLRMLGVLA